MFKNITGKIGTLSKQRIHTNRIYFKTKLIYLV